MSRRSKPFAMAFSALSFGLLGWAAAHVITDVVLAHDHFGAERHVHGYLPSMVVAAGSLAVASLLAVFLSGLAQPGTREVAEFTRPRRADIRAAAAISSAAFVDAEFGEHWWAGGQQLPAPMALLVGFAIYLLVGVGTSLLFRASVRGVTRAARRLRARLETAAIPSPITAPCPAAPALRPVHWPYVGAGRGPPVLSA